MSEHDRAWEIASAAIFEHHQYLCGRNGYTADQIVERLAQAIREHAERSDLEWLKGRAEARREGALSLRPQRDWAARTIRRLRREVRELKATWLAGDLWRYYLSYPYNTSTTWWLKRSEACKPKEPRP